MKVCLLAYEFNKSRGKGVEKYAACILEHLKKKNIEIELIERDIIKSSILYDNLTIPISLIKKIGENILFHALSPRQGIYLPLLTKKSIITFHDMIPLREIEIGEAKNKIISSIYGRFVYSLAKNTKHIIADSSQTKMELIDELRVSPEKITIVNLGVEDKFKILNKNKIDEKIRIGYLGGITKRKRVEILLKSFKKFQIDYPKINCELNIYGNLNPNGIKSEYQSLLDVVKALKIKKVNFIGFQPEKKIVEMYNSFDVFVFPTIYEGFGMPILEAQRCGLPVITMKDAKIPEEVKKETIRCNNEKDIAEKINILLTDKNFRNKIIRNGLKYSRQFTWEKCVNETIKVYEKLIH